jgi:metal-responsive CopG/Arc/MetJ family transcriptional regulator
MKTAISLPDALFLAAEKAARRLSMSRSQMYAKAIEEFVELHSQTDVTERLDRVYSENSSHLDPALKKMQRISVEDEAW